MQQTHTLEANLSRDAAMSLNTATSQRAEELFHEHQQEIFKNTDRLFAGLMLFQWIAGIVAALWLSPRTWEGTQSSIHPHVWSALVLGALISVFPIYLALAYPGKAITRYTISGAQMLMSGLLIHISGGRIETHFHIFGSLAFLAFYRDWRVLVPATIVVCFDHLLRGLFWPQSVYGVLTATPWRTIEHAGWVMFEDIFLVISCLRSTREMRSIAEQRAQLETTNQVIEEKVVQRTAEVKVSEERFRLLMDGVQDYSIIMLDPNGNIASWNEGAKRVHGYDAEEIIGQHVSRFYPKDDQPSSFSPTALDAAERVEEEGWRVRRDGSVFWANVICTPLHDETGMLRGFSRVTRDDTVRKQAEEDLRRAHDELEQRVEKRTAELANANGALQEEIQEHKESQQALEMAKAEAERANHAKSEFLSRMSHELRTPMNAILGFAQLLEMDDLSEEQEEGVGQILKAGRHLLSLINEVLEISRIEAGHLNLSIEPVCAGDTLQEALSLIVPLAQQRQVTIHSLNGCSCHIMADHQRLKQVFLNLFSNAIKYNRQGGAVTVSCKELPDHRLRITITDTGLGIAQQDIQRLFTPFERLNAVHTSIEGTGLGLALSKRLVEAMKGEMGITSQVGEGTSLWIDLPLVEAPLARHERTLTEEPEEQELYAPSRVVLCIEDNLSNLRLIERVLKNQPQVTLLSAMQGSLGIELAAQHRPDLILLDLHLPDMMGDEVLRRLQASPATRDIPVVMVSADATGGRVEKLLARGAVDYLTKPLDVKHFMGVLNKTLVEERPVAQLSA